MMKILRWSSLWLSLMFLAQLRRSIFEDAEGGEFLHAQTFSVPQAYV
jgi:hypothetical protein